MTDTRPFTGLKIEGRRDRTYWLSQEEGSDLVTLEVVLPTYQSREETLRMEQKLMPGPLPPGAAFRTRPVSAPFDDSPETAAVLRRIDAALARGEHWSTVSDTTLESIRRDWLRSRGLHWGVHPINPRIHRRGRARTGGHSPVTRAQLIDAEWEFTDPYPPIAGTAHRRSCRPRAGPRTVRSPSPCRAEHGSAGPSAAPAPVTVPG